MYESDDICQYLRETYGPAQDAYDPKALWPLTFSPFQLITSTLAAIVRGLPGGQRRADARAGNEERKPLELWGYETSPFVRPVRETLVELTLPHVMVPCCVEIKLTRRLLDGVVHPTHWLVSTQVPCARGSPNRDRMIKEQGRFQVPFLRDPNTGAELFESAAIVDYLNDVYTE